MQLYFIRHGQSANNLLYDLTDSNIGRSVDPELTDVGREQARRVAEFLISPGWPNGARDGIVQNTRGFPITHIYTSLMVRAVATGAAIAQALNLPLVGWKDLHELGGMYYEDPDTQERISQPGMTRAYFAAHYPDLLLPDEVTDAGWWNRPAETREERPPRAQRVLRTLLERHADTEDGVILVSHVGFFNHLIRAILQLSSEPALWFCINNVAISRFDFNAERVAVAYLNRVDFLPRTLIT